MVPCTNGCGWVELGLHWGLLRGECGGWLVKSGFYKSLAASLANGTYCLGALHRKFWLGKWRLAIHNRKYIWNARCLRCTTFRIFLSTFTALIGFGRNKLYFLSKTHGQSADKKSWSQGVIQRWLMMVAGTVPATFKTVVHTCKIICILIYSLWGPM